MLLLDREDDRYAFELYASGLRALRMVFPSRWPPSFALCPFCDTIELWWRRINPIPTPEEKK
jgi:hypothetical protein